MDPLTRRTLPVRRADPYLRQLHHFARVIRGEEAPVIDVAEGTRTLAATLAIAESARTGRPVRVADMLQASLRTSLAAGTPMFPLARGTAEWTWIARHARLN